MTNTFNSIGFLGCGKIAEPMIRSLVRRFPDLAINTSVRSESISSRLVEEFDKVNSGENQWVVDQSDIICLSILADTARAMLPGLTFSKDQRIFSVMADISVDEVAALVAPAGSPDVTIPLPYIEHGGCPLPVYPDDQLLRQLFGQENEVIKVEQESHIGPHFAATAVLSTLMAQLEVASVWLESKTNHYENAEMYVATLVSGYLTNLPKDGQNRFIESMQDLSTEGGLNTQLLTHMKNGNVLQQLEWGLEQLGQRLQKNSNSH